MKIASKCYMGLIYFLLYLPIAVLIFFSFNAENSTSVFGGFSLRWYGALFERSELFEAFSNSLVLALTSGLLATL
ncbi:MAG: ABC transporter permease, partial [Clostridia bacterium]|nr:ABC transporter permease [Clostridia bacterium]